MKRCLLKSSALALLVGMLALSACDSPTAIRTAFAYNPTNRSNGQLYRWANGQTIQVWVDGSAPNSVGELELATLLAIAEWNRVPRFAEFKLELANSASEAQIVVYDRSTALPVTPGSCTFDPRGAVGYTYFCATGGRAEQLKLASGGAAKASVVIRVDRAIASSQAAYSAIVAHEFGHSLGIGGHSDLSTDLMFGLPVTNIPSPRDVQTLRFVLESDAAIIL